MIPAFRLQVCVQPPGNSVEIPFVHGGVTIQPSAVLLEDHEENCVRAAEQMVRELFRKWRERKKGDTRKWSEVEAEKAKLPVKEYLSSR